MPKAPEQPARSGQPLARVGLVAVVLAGLALAHQQGLFDLMGEPARLKQALVELGPLGHLAYVLSYALLQPFGVPGTVFVLAAPLIWPWPVAFALSMVGTMAASVIGFSFARFVGRDWLAKRVPARFARWDEALGRNGFATVVLLRLIFWMPQVLHTFLGVSKVGFWTHFWGSMVGYIPPLLATAYFGERFFLAMRDLPAAAWGLLGAAVAVGLAAWWLRRRRQTNTPSFYP